MLLIYTANLRVCISSCSTKAVGLAGCLCSFFLPCISLDSMRWWYFENPRLRRHCAHGRCGFLCQNATSVHRRGSQVEAIHAMEHAQHASRPAQDGTVSDTAPVGCPPGATGANDVSRQQAGQHQVAKRPKGSEADGGGGVPVCASAATASTLSSHEAVEGGL